MVRSRWQRAALATSGMERSRCRARDERDGAAPLKTHRARDERDGAVYDEAQ